MTRFFLFALLCAGLATAGDPVRTTWIMSPSGSGAPLPSRPEVHSVTVEDDCIIVRSSGLSLKYFGPLQPSPVPSETVRDFVFKIPLHPEAETGRHTRVPVDVIGTFVNGLPIFNHFESISFNGANLWHYDAVARNDDGTLTATGHPRPDLTHPTPAGLLDAVIQSASRHSPLIGFALDGYPVYGPWTFANSDGSGGLRRMRSSYRLRSISRRRDWPDGTRLTPEQFGPDVSASDPLGTFAEDYEFASGSGDLDEFNGRFARTPEYPNGTYAYFLTTDASGRLEFPYLIGPRFYGRVPAPAGRPWYAIGLTIASARLELSASEPQIAAGESVRFRLIAQNDRKAAGEPVRHFEYVHERPIHFLIASEDLAEFAHIHPELAADDSWQVAYTFAHGGKYRIWADYSLPGEPPRVDAFDVTVAGANRARQRLVPSSLTQTVGPLTVKLTPQKPLRAGDDVPITLRLAGSTDSLEPYLGAWTHVIIVGEGFRSFAHAHPSFAQAHPIEAASTVSPAHTHATLEAPPSEIHIVTSFPSPGLYKLWAQFQNAGQVLSVPFVLRIAPAAAPPKPSINIPADAVRIRVTERGYQPTTVEIPANHALTLAFTRESTPNCGSDVVFPSLGIHRSLPFGETVLIQLPAQSAGEIGFSCGVGMYRGMIVAR